MIALRKDKFSYFDRLYSYLAPTTLWVDLLTESSIVYRYNKLYLNAASVNYSYGELLNAFKQFFGIYGTAFVRSKKRMLMLGFGLGSVSEFMMNQNSDLYVDGVESNRGYIHFFENYFDYNMLTLYTLDAYEYVSSCSIGYDLIVIDLFVDTIIPNFAKSVDFLAKLDELLLTNGMIIFNSMPNNLPEINHFKAIFDHSISVPLGNTFWIKTKK